MKRKILSCTLYLVLLLSVSINIYFFMPPKTSESISVGFYTERNTYGTSYKLSITHDNKLLLYGSQNDLIFEGKFEYLEKENHYLITTDSNIYQVAALDNILFLPINENGRTISKLFEKVDNIPVTFDQP